MKVQVSKIMLAASLFSIGGLASAAPPTVPPDNMRFLHAEDPVGSTAACLVSAGNPGPGIAACICAATGSNDACNAEGGNSFAVHPLFEASWAAALKTNESLLYGEVADGWYNAPFAETGVTDGPLNVKLDARGSCGLTQGALELAVDFPTNQAKSKLKGIVGAKAMYSAVYMFPVRAPVPVGENTPIWEDVPGTSPVRLCSLGQAQVMTAGQLKMGRGRHGHSPEGSGRVVDFAANLSCQVPGDCMAVC